MKQAIAMIVFVLMTGCISIPKFQAQTKNGAKCKHECAMSNMHCRHSGWGGRQCAVPYRDCLNSCQEIDLLASKDTLRATK